MVSIIARATRSLVRDQISTVALARRHQTALILLLDFQYFGFGLFQNGFFLDRRGHIVNADGDTGAGRKPESGVHQFVGKHHCIF